jgi:hypothetical protein
MLPALVRRPMGWRPRLCGGGAPALTMHPRCAAGEHGVLRWVQDCHVLGLLGLGVAADGQSDVPTGWAGGGVRHTQGDEGHRCEQRRSRRHRDEPLHRSHGTPAHPAATNVPPAVLVTSPSPLGSSQGYLSNERSALRSAFVRGERPNRRNIRSGTMRCASTRAQNTGRALPAFLPAGQLVPYAPALPAAPLTMCGRPGAQP